jgi:hypothetical protein
MEIREGPQTPYEVYCHHCRVTFAAGTRNCVHCGRRVSAPGRTQTVAGALTEAPAELEAAEPTPLRRFGGMSLWVLLALGAALSRMCEGG